MYQSKQSPVTVLAEAQAGVAERRSRGLLGILDIKQMNDLASDYRREIKTLIMRLRRLQNASPFAGDMQAKRAAILTRREIADLWMLYRMARADGCKLTRDYMRDLSRQAA